MANIDLIRDNSGIKKSDGGRYWWYCRCNSDGSDKIGESWHVGTYKQKTDIDFDIPLEPIPDEIDDIVATDSGTVKFEIQITSMQADARTLMFLLKETGPNNYYKLCYHDGTGLSGANKFVYCPVGNFAKQIKKSNPDNQKPIFTFLGLAPTVAWNGNSLTAASVTAYTPNPSALSASLSGIAGEYLAIAE